MRQQEKTIVSFCFLNCSRFVHHSSVILNEELKSMLQKILENMLSFIYHRVDIQVCTSEKANGWVIIEERYLEVYFLMNVFILFQALHVHHHDYITDQDHNITVLVLDCDSITQTKSKLLDVLYKNIPFSQRPNVHQTTLGILTFFRLPLSLRAKVNLFMLFDRAFFLQSRIKILCRVNEVAD